MRCIISLFSISRKDKSFDEKTILLLLYLSLCKNYIMQSKWSAEFVFLIITAIIAYAIMWPVQHYVIRYGFTWSNYLFIFVVLTYTRYIFLLKYTPFSYNHWVKLFFIFGSIPMFFILIDKMYEFFRMLDEVGLESYINSDSFNTQIAIAKYTKYQFIFFSASTFIVLVVLPIRFIKSIWRVKNNKGIV
jgi:hypothetical protein